MASSKKAIYAALIGNTLIALTKFIAAAITGSSAMLAEGIHSCVDTGNQLLLLYGLKKAQKPPDARYPFGYGKEVYFWSFVVAILIFAVGAGVSIYEGILHIIKPGRLEDVYINYIVLGLAVIFEGSALYFALAEFNKTKGSASYIEAIHRGKDPTLFVVVFEDSAALLGLLVAFLGIFLGQMTGNLYFDGAASIIVGLILGATALWLAIETKSLLIGESAKSATVQGIRELVVADKDILHVNEVLTLHMGPQYVLVNLSVDFLDTLPAGRIEKTISQLDKKIKETYPEVKRVFVEAEGRQTDVNHDTDE